MWRLGYPCSPCFYWRSFAEILLSLIHSWSKIRFLKCSQWIHSHEGINSCIPPVTGYWPLSRKELFSALLSFFILPLFGKKRPSSLGVSSWCNSCLSCSFPNSYFEVSLSGWSELCILSCLFFSLSVNEVWAIKWNTEFCNVTICVLARRVLPLCFSSSKFRSSELFNRKGWKFLRLCTKTCWAARANICVDCWGLLFFGDFFFPFLSLC